MVYVRGDGTVVDRKDFSIFGWFWAIVNFIYLLYHIVTSLLFAIVNSSINSFQTLINPNYNKHGDKYVRDFRPPGSGPPKPPSRKFGGFGPSGSAPPPPPMGGGCGCG